jgi:glycosyl transferase family 87
VAPLPAEATAGPALSPPATTDAHRFPLKLGRPGWLTRPAARAVRDALVVLGLVYAVYQFLVLGPSSHILGYDAWSYWAVDLDHLYAGSIGDLGWFPYSPALAQVSSVFHFLSWPTFLLLWLSFLVATVVWLGRRQTILLLAFPPVAAELYHANINLLLAAAIVLGFRYPAAWSFVLLGKITPGIGLLWFAVRREWGHLAIALGATALLAAVSFAVAPQLWFDWGRAIVASSAASPVVFNPPLWLRLPIAAAVVIWGARTDRPWTVPVSAVIAMPVWWLAVFSILAAIVPLRRDREVANRSAAAG